MRNINKITLRLAKRYVVENAASTSLNELTEFFKKAYTDQFNVADYKDASRVIDFWEWINIRNPAIQSGQFPAWVCRNKQNNTIVGHFAVMPVFLKIKNDCTSAVWGRSLIVLPEVRKFGIGPFLIHEVLKKTCNTASIFMIAGLNDEVYSIYKKFGFIDMGHIPLYVRINHLGSLFTKLMPSKILARILTTVGEDVLKVVHFPSYIKRCLFNNKSTIHVSEIKCFNASFDNLWKKVSSSFSIIAKRDSFHLNWRFVNQPYGDYRIFKAECVAKRELKGYVVLREGWSRGLRLGIISDMLASQNDTITFNKLIHFAIEHFEKKKNINLIRCDIMNKSIAKLLKRCGFFSMKSNSRFMFTNVHKDVDLQFIGDQKNWFINYADSDLDLSVRRYPA